MAHYSILETKQEIIIAFMVHLFEFWEYGRANFNHYSFPVPIFFISIKNLLQQLIIYDAVFIVLQHFFRLFEEL